MKKKYQVFVSSTYLDLLDERQKVMYALLELDCIPSGMELFPAADMAQWELIKRVIDECDYYVVIIGGRYGSIGPETKSYTQMEYEYAALLRKPVVAFLHKDPGSLPESKKEKTSEAQKKLTDFRALVQLRMCKYWTSADNLAAGVTQSLVKLKEDNPAAGWVRGDSTGIFYDELAGLEKQLRKEIIYERTSLLKIVQSIAEQYGDEVSTIDDFMDAVDEQYDSDPTNLTYWWLLIHGVFRFKELSPWFDDNGLNWKKSVRYARFTDRGKMLYQKLCARPLPSSKETF